MGAVVRCQIVVVGKIMTQKKCPCVCDRSLNPYRTDECADYQCKFCDGTGTIKIRVSHEKPPIPTVDFDYAAWVDGTEEDGPTGRGASSDLAIGDLLSSIEGIV